MTYDENKTTAVAQCNLAIHMRDRELAQIPRKKRLTQRNKQASECFREECCKKCYVVLFESIERVADIRAEGPAVCLAQAEGLGSRPSSDMKGQRPGRLRTATALQTDGPLALAIVSFIGSQAFCLG